MDKFVEHILSKYKLNKFPDLILNAQDARSHSTKLETTSTASDIIMSTAAKAKEALEISYVEYKRCKARVTKALGSTAHNERALSSKMQQLSDALSKLNVHHTTWVSKANLTDEQLRC